MEQSIVNVLKGSFLLFSLVEMFDLQVSLTDDGQFLEPHIVSTAI